MTKPRSSHRKWGPTKFDEADLVHEIAKAIETTSGPDQVFTVRTALSAADHGRVVVNLWIVDL